VAEALLCSDLGVPGGSRTRTNWECETAEDAAVGGALFYYTRLAVDRDTTVQHRWYRGDTLRQSVELRVRANPQGYRTFSRKRLAESDAGEWRVELRGQDDTLLHEERFVVR
jgi:hypothetical protein